MPLPLQGLQHPPGVAAVAQGGVIAGLARLDLENIQNFLHHDGNMHAGGGLAALDDLFHIRLVLLRIQFLVFFPVASGVGAFVADAPLVLLLHGISSFIYWWVSYHSFPKKRREWENLAFSGKQRYNGEKRGR